MKAYGIDIREHLSDEEIIVNLLECVVHLAEKDDDSNIIKLQVEGAKITLHVDFSGV